LSNIDPPVDSEHADSLREQSKNYAPSLLSAWLIASYLSIPALAQNNAAEKDLDSAFQSGTIIIEADQDACYRFDVYLAITRQQQIRGLMHVRRLPAFHGMLFDYSDTKPAIHSMWMKNTYIPLDILFIHEDGRIANIEANTVPLSLKSITSIEPVSYVLELNAGVAERLDITTNSRVLISITEASE
jgi:uncharacterized membrane protein (UPF0127 family)